MPINEAKGFYPSTLSPKEQDEAMRAIYGEPMSPDTQLTYEELARMRQIIAAHDKQAGTMKEFDINKPDTPRYVFREYPFLMYNHETGQTKPAVNFEHRQQLLAQGWSEDSVPPQPREIELTPEETAEAQAVDKQLSKKRKS